MSVWLTPWPAVDAPTTSSASVLLSAELPALPCVTFQLGVTGNRRLDQARIARIQQRLEETLTAIAAPLASATMSKESRGARQDGSCRRAALRNMRRSSPGDRNL